MRGWAWVAIIIAGVLVVIGASAAVSSGRDHTGETVRASRWADRVCGATGAWEGQLEGIRDEIRKSNDGARQSDGGSGDSVEETILTRQAVDRAIRATTDVLQTGLKRAGIPDANRGAAASGVLTDWARRVETNLRLSKTQLKVKPQSPAESFGNLGSPILAVAVSVIQGRAAFRHAAALDPAIADALHGSRNCRDLMKEAP